MAINKTPPQNTTATENNRGMPATERENQFVNQIRQWIAVAINVYADTVSLVRRENDTFYDGIPADRLRPNTNGPRVIMNDVQPAVDRVVSQVASAFFREDCVEAEPIGEDDIEAAEQSTAMVRHVLFTQNDGKLLLRDSIKSAAKYPFGGAMRVYRDERTRTTFHEVLLTNVTDMTAAEQAAAVIASSNTEAGLREWRLLKIREETYEDPVPGFEGTTALRREYTARYEITHTEVTFPILVIPPEEFLMDKEATSIRDCKFVCQRRFMPRSDIMTMWPEARQFPEDLGSVATSYNTNFSNEKQYRRRVHNTLNVTSRPATFDSTMSVSLVVEGYVRYDYDGDGLAEWRHFAVVDDTILENTYWDGPLPFVLPNLNRDPHRPDEITIAERAKDSTLAKTAMLRGDLKAQQDRTNLQLIAKSGAFPLTGQRKLMEGTPGIIPYGQNEQGQPLAISGPLSDSVFAIPKPEPSQATQGLWQMLDSQRSSQVGANSLNDAVQRQRQSSNPATTVMLQQREQDIQIEDYIMCYGETAVKPLYRIINWFLNADADHASIKQQYLTVTGKPNLDSERASAGEWRLRDQFKVNVGLGVDSAEYKQQRAGMLLQVTAAFNQAMTAGTLPNLLPKMYEAFRDQVTALGYDADKMLMSRLEFQQFQQAMAQQSQMAQQQQQQQAAAQAEQQQQMLALQLQSLQADIQEKMAKASKAEADAIKARAEAQIAVMQAQVGDIQPARVVI